MLDVPSTINRMTNYDRLAFVTTATCDFSVCDDFNVHSGGVQFLINPNGVVFGQGAQVNVGGLVASTLDFNNAAVQSAVAECEDRRFDGMHFCHDDPQVEQAGRNYWTACSGPPH